MDSRKSVPRGVTGFCVILMEDVQLFLFIKEKQLAVAFWRRFSETPKYPERNCRNRFDTSRRGNTELQVERNPGIRRPPHDPVQ